MISSINIQSLRNKIFLFVTTNENNHELLKDTQMSKKTDKIY